MTVTNIPLIRAIGDVEWGSGNVSEDFYYMLDNSQSLSHVTTAEWRWWDKDGANDIKGLNTIKNFWEPIEVKFREVKWSLYLGSAVKLDGSKYRLKLKRLKNLKFQPSTAQSIIGWMIWISYLTSWRLNCPFDFEDSFLFLVPQIEGSGFHPTILLILKTIVCSRLKCGLVIPFTDHLTGLNVIGNLFIDYSKPIRWLFEWKRTIIE